MLLIGRILYFHLPRCRNLNEQIMMDFINNKKMLEDVLIENFPDMLNRTIEYLEDLNETLEQAHEDHTHTFSMMKYILR